MKGVECVNCGNTFTPRRPLTKGRQCPECRSTNLKYISEQESGNIKFPKEPTKIEPEKPKEPEKFVWKNPLGPYEKKPQIPKQEGPESPSKAIKKVEEYIPTEDDIWNPYNMNLVINGHALRCKAYPEIYGEDDDDRNKSKEDNG